LVAWGTWAYFQNTYCKSIFFTDNNCAVFLVAIGFYWIKFTSVSTHADGENIKEMLLKNIQQLKQSWKQEAAFILLFFIVLVIRA